MEKTVGRVSDFRALERNVPTFPDIVVLAYDDLFFIELAAIYIVAAFKRIDETGNGLMRLSAAANCRKANQNYEIFREFHGKQIMQEIFSAFSYRNTDIATHAKSVKFHETG